MVLLLVSLVSSNIEVRVGDLFASGAQTLVNTVNTEGVMGKGVALQFRKRFPDMFDDYVRRCRHGDVRIGEPYVYRGPHDQWILNFPTKRKWREHSQPAYVETGFLFLHADYREW